MGGIFNTDSGYGPPASPAEQLTAAFYQWEIRGRGWQVWPYPVELEPPFRPFFFHAVQSTPSQRDDGRRPTVLSSLADGVRGFLSGATETSALVPASSVEDWEEEPLPVLAWDEDALVEFKLALPPDLDAGKETIERFLTNLGSCQHPLSFEIVGLPAATSIQLGCRKADAPHVRQQLQAYFPDVLVQETDGFLNDLWEGNKPSMVVDFGLSDEFMLPVRTFARLDPDPLVGLFGALADIRDGELGIVQVLFEKVREPWAESILRSVTDWEGRPFFRDAPHMPALARQKVAKPLYAAVVRIAAQSPRAERAWEIVRTLGGAFAQFAEPTSNTLIPLDNDGYSEESHAQNVPERRSNRCGMLLNLDELVGLVHLPSSSVRSEKFKRERKRTKGAPVSAQGAQMVLGENTHAGRTLTVTLTPEQRVRHTYVIGASGTGKSTLLLNLLVQDIQNGEGVALLDPHGDLVDSVLARIPEKRFADVVLLDPSDPDYAIGFNILSAHSELEKNLLASDLVAVFRRLSTSWGDQMNSVLGNAILAFLESEQGGTLADMRRFLVEPEFRRAFLKTVRDREVVYYWEREFSLLAGKPQAPLLTRLDTFLRPKLIRHMVSQKENRIEFGSILNGGKIFLAKLAQGLIGEENAYLLGTLLVSKFHQLAIARQEIAAEARRNFYLYVDEFHSFVTPSMASILSGARKYRLGLVLAHQELSQLAAKSPEVASAVISNPATRVCFRVGDQDGKRLADGFSFFDDKDLQNLGIGEAICRVERADFDFNLRTLPAPEVSDDTAREKREAIVSLSRKKYARARVDIEAELAAVAPAREIHTALPPPKEPAIAPPERRPEPVKEMKIPTPPSRIVELGRGGQQHKYLQNLIKRLAEEKGYRATIEKPILDGIGSVDVALEREKARIACEITVTTTVEHEIGNVQKCLAAGFDWIVLVATDKKTLTSARPLILEAVSEKDAARVRCLSPEELFVFLDELEAQAAGTEKTVRGYRVKVKYKPVSEAEKQSRKQAIAQTIAQALKRLKPKP